MGTNYYHRTNICECCGRYDEKHIGKSSAGWTFTFQAYVEKFGYEPPNVIKSYDDWLSRLSAGGEIHDEYGDLCTLDKFKELVEAKQSNPANKNHAATYGGGPVHWSWGEPDDWVDPEGYSFSARDFS